MHPRVSMSSDYLAVPNNDPENTSLITEKAVFNARPQTFEQLFKIAVLGALAYICLLETLHLSSSKACINQPTYNLPYSPIREAIVYDRKPVWQDDDFSVFDKEPGPELDALWDDLLTGQNVRVSEREMMLQNENLTNRVQLADGDYLGIISVWHDLHCLDVLRRALHMDHYGPLMSKAEERSGIFTPEHYDHCVERLRQSLMCHADTAIYVPEWIADSHVQESKAMKSNAETVCVNWEALDVWARKRALKKHEFKVKAGPFEVSS